MSRRIPLALLVLAGGLASSEAGRVVRVPAPKRVEIRVPAGRFWMGVDEDTKNAAVLQCGMVFPALTGTTRVPPAPGQPLPAPQRVDFCGDYADALAAMPPREVFVDTFYIDRDEVTVGEYRSCVAGGRCDLDPLVAGDERYIRDGWPLVNVTWRESRDFCRWRGARLPTEAEWERAARGDDAEATWPWGALEQPKEFNHGQPRAQAMRDIDQRSLGPVPLQFFGDPDEIDGHAILAPPGSYVWGESSYGVRDLAGNVAEWTADAWLHENTPPPRPNAPPGTPPATPRKGYDGLDRINPYREGVHTDPRIVRGGSWRQPTFVAKSNLRDPFNKEYDPQQRFSHVGFRCARSDRQLDVIPARGR